MLKKASCMVPEPHMVATLNGISVGKAKGLLDGGATHNLRHAAPSEYRLARPVQVRLASGSTCDLRMNAVGTLLSQHADVQPIDPASPQAAGSSRPFKLEERWERMASGPMSCGRTAALLVPES